MPFSSPKVLLYDGQHTLTLIGQDIPTLVDHELVGVYLQ